MGATYINLTTYAIIAAMQGAREGRRKYRRFGGEKIVIGFDDEEKTYLTQKQVIEKEKNENKDIDDFYEDIKKKIALRKRKIKLETLFLIYIFDNDDGKIDFFEKRVIKKMFSPYKKIMTDKDIEDIISISQHAKSPTLINEYINTKEYTELEIKRALDSIKISTEDKQEYRILLIKLKMYLFPKEYK